MAGGELKRWIPGSSGLPFLPLPEQPRFLSRWVVEDSVWNKDSGVKEETENAWTT